MINLFLFIREVYDWMNSAVIWAIIIVIFILLLCISGERQEVDESTDSDDNSDSNSDKHSGFLRMYVPPGSIKPKRRARTNRKIAPRKLPKLLPPKN